MTFQIHALPYGPFAALFTMPAEALERRGAVMVTVRDCPGTPCRVSLKDAEIGERVVLVNHASLDEPTPYRATHAIFVREGATQAMPAPGEIPPAVLTRLLSVRAFGADHMMIRADVVEGRALAPMLGDFLADPAVACVHLHNARQGCFSDRVMRTASVPQE